MDFRRRPAQVGATASCPGRGGQRMSTYSVGYLVGSLSSTSINRRLAQAMIKLAPPELKFTEIPFRDLPIYSPDYDADYPPPAWALKQAIKSVDAIWFVTPE